MLGTALGPGNLAGTKKDSVSALKQGSKESGGHVRKELTWLRNRKKASVTGAQGGERDERLCWSLSNPECPLWSQAHGEHAVTKPWMKE